MMNYDGLACLLCSPHHVAFSSHNYTSSVPIIQKALTLSNSFLQFILSTIIQSSSSLVLHSRTLSLLFLSV